LANAQNLQNLQRDQKPKSSPQTSKPSPKKCGPPSQHSFILARAILASKFILKIAIAVQIFARTKRVSGHPLKQQSIVSVLTAGLFGVTCFPIQVVFEIAALLKSRFAASERRHQKAA